MPLREVRLSADYDSSDYGAFRLNYLDPIAKRPIPSTRVYRGDQLVIETNSLSCYGREPTPGAPLIGVFGDSVVQGVGDSFVNHIHIDGYEALNGGVEGAQLHQIIDRAEEVQSRVALRAVVIHPGFHNLIYNETGFMYWEQQLARLKGGSVIAVFRLTADINSDSVEHGYESLYSSGYLPMHHSKDRKTLEEFKKALEQKNRLIEKCASMWGYLLIDLDPVLAPTAYADIGARFFDILHPKPDIYREIGRAVAERLAPLLADQPPQFRAAPSEASTSSLTGQHGRTYPLW